MQASKKAQKTPIQFNDWGKTSMVPICKNAMPNFSKTSLCVGGD